MPKTTNRLTAIKAQTVKKPGLHPDGAGLYLKIGAGGSSRSWVLRYMLKGRPRYLGLGSAAHVSLAEARDLANRARELSRQGVDPIDYRTRARIAEGSVRETSKVDGYVGYPLP